MEDPTSTSTPVFGLPDGDQEQVHAVKPALKHGYHDGRRGDGSSNNKKKKGLKWDEAKIQEHDQLRGTRMKIEEPNTPYHHNYDSGSETDGSHTGGKEKELSWDHLQNKLEGVAAVRDAYPSSPSSHGGGEENDNDNDNTNDNHQERQTELKHLEFNELRKRHYNEMELVRKFRQEHPGDALEGAVDDGNDIDNDISNDADDEDDRKPAATN
jgi:protein phosphatase inhibitor 2